MLPDNEPLKSLQERDVLALGASVKDGVNACRDALAAWLGSSEPGPVEEAVAEVSARMLRSVACSEARPAGPATTLLVRLLLVALIEEMGRAHILSPN
jgi:hypothetical protein